MSAPFVSSRIILASGLSTQTWSIPSHPQKYRRKHNDICCDKVGHDQFLLTSGADI